MSGSPMDPKRLAELRIKVDGMVEYCAAQTEGGTGQWTPVAELLADRDHFRSRCPVTAEDCERAGVTSERVRDWMSGQGWAQLVSDRTGWETWADDHNGADVPEVDVFHERHDAAPWLAIRFIADHTDRPAFDILDEMAKGAAR